MKKLLAINLVVLTGLLLSAETAMSTVWTKTTPTGGTVTFDDWGITGPGGRTAMDYAPVNGFGANTLDPTGGIGQIQHVVTVAPDRLTPDQPSPARPLTSGTNFIKHDEATLGSLPTYSANMDSQTNFYKWGYTSPAGSTFNNMQIDYDGDYHIARDDMSFGYYGLLDYQDTTGQNPSFVEPTSFQFQPFAVSDARGWCGSILASHPAALEAMAGQVSFDFAFDVYSDYGAQKLTAQYIPGFEMRSYGTLTIQEQRGTFNQQFKASAVINNTNPLAGVHSTGPDAPVDPDFYNIVSFMGGGTVPNQVYIVQYWVDALGNNVPAGDPRADHVDTHKTGIVNGPGTYWVDANGYVVDATNPAADHQVTATLHVNSFGGYSFLLRADAQRTIDYFDVSQYGPAPSSVPEPGSILLIASGLFGLCSLKKKQ